MRLADVTQNGLMTACMLIAYEHRINLFLVANSFNLSGRRPLHFDVFSHLE